VISNQSFLDGDRTSLLERRPTVRATHNGPRQQRERRSRRLKQQRVHATTANDLVKYATDQYVLPIRGPGFTTVAVLSKDAFHLSLFLQWRRLRSSGHQASPCDYCDRV